MRTVCQTVLTVRGERSSCEIVTAGGSATVGGCGSCESGRKQACSAQPNLSPRGKQLVSISFRLELLSAFLLFASFFVFTWTHTRYTLISVRYFYASPLPSHAVILTFSVPFSHFRAPSHLLLCVCVISRCHPLCVLFVCVVPRCPVVCCVFVLSPIVLTGVRAVPPTRQGEKKAKEANKDLGFVTKLLLA